MKLQKQLEISFPIVIILFFWAVFAWGCEHKEAKELTLELGLCQEYSNGTYDRVLELSQELYEAEKKIDSLQHPGKYENF